MPSHSPKKTQNVPPIVLVGLVLMVVALVVGISFIRQSQESRSQALIVPRAGGNCVEQCPGSDGVLRNCHPPEDDGSAAESICAWAGRVEFCGTRNFCCPSAGGQWTTNMTACATPTPTRSPSPTAAPSPTSAPSPTVTPTINPSISPSPTAVPTLNPSLSPTPTTNPSLSPTPTGSSKRGDLDGNDSVTIEDVNMLLNVYGRSVTLLPAADLNGDGKIDAIDYAIITDLLGT